MKKILGIVLALTCAVTACFSLAGCKSGNGKETLTVYTNSGFAPFEFINDKGELVGVDIDIAEELGDVLGMNVVIKDVDFDSIETYVQGDKNAIGLAGKTIHSEDTNGAYSNSYFTSTQYAVVPEDFTAEETITVADLAGKKIGVQTSTTGNFLIADAIDLSEGDLYGTNATCVDVSNILVMGNSLGGLIDVIVIDELPAESIAAGKTGYKAVKIDVEPESYGVYVNKDATELLAKINTVIDKLVETGAIDYFVAKHLGLGK